MTNVQVRSAPADLAGAWSATRDTRLAGGWRLVARLASGRCADVFLASPVDAISRPTKAEEGAGNAPAYVVKRLRDEWQDDFAARQRLAREAAVARSVTHPHLSPILCCQVSTPPYYLVMPRLQGSTLAAEMAGGPLAIGAALCVARQAAEALDALHAAGWTHGDIKPTNAIVSPQGHVTLIDLEFATRPGEECAWDRPATAGTANYLAPEWTTSAYAPDIRADIYSLGVTLYQMLCGCLPFEAASGWDLVRMHQQARAADVRETRGEVSEAVAGLVQRMLAKDPWRRPACPRELVRELVRLELAHWPCGGRASGEG